MAEGRLTHDWNRTADGLALLANIHRDPKRRHRPFGREDFHPLAHRRQSPIQARPDMTINIRDLGSILPGIRPGRPPQRGPTDGR